MSQLYVTLELSENHHKASIVRIRLDYLTPLERARKIGEQSRASAKNKEMYRAVPLLSEAFLYSIPSLFKNMSYPRDLLKGLVFYVYHWFKTQFSRRNIQHSVILLSKLRAISVIVEIVRIGKVLRKPYSGQETAILCFCNSLLLLCEKHITLTGLQINFLENEPFLQSNSLLSNDGILDIM